jgi:hypothetical protein
LARAALNGFTTAFLSLLPQRSARQAWLSSPAGRGVFSQKYRETRGEALTLRGENAMMGELKQAT